MTTPPDVEHAAVPAADEPPAPRLERPAGPPYRGVARALAAATGTDPILWRVLFVVLVFFDGLGLLLYLVGLVCIPQVGQRRSLAQRVVQGPHRGVHLPELILLSVLLISTLVLLSDGHGLLTVAVLGVLALLVLRQPRESGYVVGPRVDEAEGAAPAWEAPAAPPAPRPRSALGRLTVSVALLVVAVELLVAAAGSTAITERVVLASALVVVGIGLVVGAWWGRSPGLVVLAFLLTLGLVATTAVDGVVGHGVGERHWRPVTAGSYELGIGEAVLDLRDPALAQAEGTLDARVGIGHLVVLAPTGADRVLPRFLGGRRFGCGIDQVDVNGDLRGLVLQNGSHRETGGFDREMSLRLAELPNLQVQLEVGIGEIEVCHV